MFSLRRLWASVRGRCSLCGEKLVLQTVRESQGVHDNVTVTFSNLPYRGCPVDTLERYYPSRGFVFQLVRALVDPRQISALEIDEKGQMTCRRCGQSLQNELRAPTPVTGRLSLRGLPQFGIVIRGLTVTCPGCRTEQVAVDWRRAGPLSAAIQAALEAAGVKP